MSNILGQKWLLNRRHFLRGAGASVALPLLNCMTPLRLSAAAGAAEAAAAAKPRRSVFIYVPNGVNVLTWQITEAGKDYQFSEPLKVLERHRQNITPISGLYHPNGIGQAHECAKIWLTAAKISQEGGAFRNSVSADQLMAEVTSPQTRFGSLELSISRGDTTLGWSRDGVPLPAEDNPKNVFLRLFGEEKGGVEVQRRRLNRRHSVLDVVLDDAQALKKNLGTEDRTKLDEYLHSVRDVEIRTERLDSWLNVPKPKVEKDVEANLTRVVDRSQAGDYYRTMYDLILLTLRTDMTRVVTYMSGSESNGLAIPEIGIPQTRHELSHHNGDPEQMRRLSQSDAFLVEQYAYFLDQLAAVRDGDETLLDRTMVLFGSGMAYGHSHGNANLPTILAGGKSLGLKHGQHIDYNLPKIGQYELVPAKQYGVCSRPVDGNARLTNLLLTMLNKMEVNVEQFADSLGPINELSA